MPSSSAHSGLPLLPQVAATDLRLVLDDFPTKVQERGRRYFTEKRVGPLEPDGGAIAAVVQGSEPYEAFWEWVDGGWDFDCTCPMGYDCKHVFALGMQILHDFAPSVAVETHAAFEAVPVEPVGSLSAAIKLPASNATALHKLRDAPDLFRAERALGEMLAEERGHGINVFTHSFREILEEPDADLRCWRLAHEISRLSRGWVPRPLRPFLERDDLNRKYRGRLEDELTNEILRWAAQRPEAPTKSLRVVISIHASSGGATLEIQARVSSAKLRDAVRSLPQLQTLLEEVQDGETVLQPQDLVLLKWLVDHQIGQGDGYSTFGSGARSAVARIKLLLDAFPNSPLIQWDRAIPDEFIERGGIVQGGGVRLSHEPVQLIPVPVENGDEVELQLAFAWPNGDHRPASEVVYFRHRSHTPDGTSSLVLADGAFHIVSRELPDEIITRFVQVGAVPVRADERAKIMTALAATIEPARRAIDAHTKFRRVAPVVTIDLREDDWIQLRLLTPPRESGWRPGSPDPEGGLFEISPTEGWVQVETSGAATVSSIESAPVDPEQEAAPDANDENAGPEHVWCEAPAPEDIDPVVKWIAELGATAGTQGRPGGLGVTWPDAHIGWWTYASKKKMEILAELWDRRPPGVAFFGTERMRRLLSGLDRIAAKIRVTPSGVDWFTVSAEWDSEGRRLSEADLARLRAADSRFVKISDGWVRKDVAESYDDAAALLADLGIDLSDEPQAVSLWQLAGASDESISQLEQIGVDSATLTTLHDLRERIANFDGLPHIGKPTGVLADMRPYQCHGVDFLTNASTLGIGTILADDMGLGKTLQALAWIEHLRETDPAGGPVLVVCPTSVVHNWVREAQRFTPGLKVLTLASGQDRHELWNEIGAHDLILTNYALLRRDSEKWGKIELRAAILDEAQNIKNPDAAVTRAALALRAKHRVALTGTPLENRALDLWSISSFVNPGYLGSRSRFADRYDRPDGPPHSRTLLAAKLRPILLRRSKQEVAPELPDRIEERRDCELQPGQRQLYIAELHRSRSLVDDLTRETGGFKKNKIHILAALTRLRQICCHPALAGGKKSLGSGKFDALFDLLEPLLEEGHKVLLFSQFVECLKLLQTEMETRKIAHYLLTGQTPAAKRKDIVTKFQADPDPGVFLISLKAGGTGLNLTAASYVVVFDPWWNPAVEAQAIDRTHRIGQDRTVIAYRMIATGTIEEKIFELQQRKAAMVKDILGETGFARALTKDDLEYLLQIDE